MKKLICITMLVAIATTTIACKGNGIRSHKDSAPTLTTGSDTAAQGSAKTDTVAPDTGRGNSPNLDTSTRR